MKKKILSFVDFLYPETKGDKLALLPVESCEILIDFINSVYGSNFQIREDKSVAIRGAYYTRSFLDEVERKLRYFNEKILPVVNRITEETREKNIIYGIENMQYNSIQEEHEKLIQKRISLSKPIAYATANVTAMGQTRWVYVSSCSCTPGTGSYYYIASNVNASVIDGGRNIYWTSEGYYIIEIGGIIIDAISGAQNTYFSAVDYL